MPSVITEVPDSGRTFVDTEFVANNADIAEEWKRIKDIYPSGSSKPLLPETFSREQFGQGTHYECFMLSALSTLVKFPEVIRNCFVSKKVRQDGRYTFQFFRGKEWVKVEIDDTIAMEDGDILYCQSPTEHWWPLLLEKAYAKFYTAYDHLDGCTLQETFHDLTGNPVLNIPMDPKLAKAANCNVLEGRYWLDLAQRIQSGEFVASALTKDVEVENMGLQREQQYGILDVFSLSGTSAVDDIVVHMHNPFEDDEFAYTGPLNRNDAAWTEKQRVRHDVDNPRSIFLPLNIFLRVVNSMQLCYVSTIESDATYFEDQWKGESAGGNPTFVTWRKNPLYYISNHGTEAVTLSFVVKQKDQRHLKGPEQETTYMQCGMILSQYSYLYPIPSFWVTGNNHKPIHKSLFLNSREVANSVVIPPQSLCYLVPSCMRKGEEASFLLATYRMAHEDYSKITMRRLDLPEMDWRHPAIGNVELQMRTKDRLDFYVDEETDVHILMHQTKPYISPKTGGDAMAQDYMGMYLYDDTDRKIAGVHAATNFRETSIIHHLPRSGRYALSLTCPRGKGSVPATVTIVTSLSSHARRVETPADAAVLPDEMELVEEDSENTKAARIDFHPFKAPASEVREVPDSSVPFEDRGFMLDNRDLTPDPWVHIGDLYPEGKTKPLLPDTLSRAQFEQGATPECCCLTAFATLAEHHPDVIRNCFVTKKPRRDGRYTFQFHRYGQWVKVEIDDRIPKINNDTVFCRSPTHHWWPLLLEKAYAKFYTLYENLEGCSIAEVYHDFSGCPVINVPLEPATAHSAGFDVSSPAFWVQLRKELPTTAMAAQSSDDADRLGVNPQQFYGVLDIIPTSVNPQSLADVVVQLHNPYADSTYTGPMSHKSDRRWSTPQLQSHEPSQNTMYVPADTFVANFLTLSQAHLRGLVEPCWNFNSEWGEGTNGGNPSLLTWRENPLYVVRNSSSEPVEIVGMIRQPDKRHQYHLLAELDYVRCDLLLAQSTENDSIPTYLVTHNNHRIVHKGVFLNYREVANFISVPAKSLCYLVPTAMYHEKSIFMLSYWYRKPADERAVGVARLKASVARDLPAVKHVTMLPRGKDRVDFLVDVPTDAHILLSQWNHDAKGGSDVRTDNYVGMYLYDDNNQQVARVSSASNLKEIGLVTHLPAAGHYVLSLTCPVAKDDEVKCRVEVVCVEAARVRITDAYENEPNFDDLRDEPPVQPVDMEDVMDPDRHIRAVEPIVASKPAVNTVQQPPAASRAVPAEEAEEASVTPSLSFLDSAYHGVPRDDIPLLENPAFARLAEEREALKKHPSKNASRINAIEKQMHDLAGKMADDMHKKERAYLDPQPTGVPLELLKLNDDDAFAALEHDLRVAMADPQASPDAVAALQDKLNDRAREMAKELKDEERERFLNPMPLGIPVAELHLDEDPEFRELEVARLRERMKDKPDNAKIRKLEDAMNARAEELAKKKLAEHRDYLKPEHLHVANSELPLSDDRDFVMKEAARQEKLAMPRPNPRAIAALEDELNAMAEEMAAELLAEQRPSYLAADHHGRHIDELPLNADDAFLREERERRDLLKEPQPDLDRVADLEDDLNQRADEMAKAMNKAERPQYLKASYFGKPVEQLPLDDDAVIAELEAQRARLRRDPGHNAPAIRAVEDKINARVEELAKDQVDQDRKARYGSPNGIPVELLDLDGDATMRRLEAEHMDLLGMSKPDQRALAANEAKLQARAMQLAQEFLDNLRADITGSRPATPSALSDAPFLDMEARLIALMSEDPKGNEEQIADLKSAMAKRNAELKRQQAQALRAFLEPTPLGIPLEDLDLDGDAEFLAKEAALRAAVAAKASPEKLERLQAEMQERVNALAAEELARRYPYMETRPANVPLEAMPQIATDGPLWDAIEAAEHEKRRGGPQMRVLQAAVNDRLRKLAEDQKLADRAAYLPEKPAGVEARHIPFDDDEEFVHKSEERHRLLHEDPKANAARIRDLEKQLRERAEELADAKKWADRNAVLDPKPEGVKLAHVPLDKDGDFLAMEDEWRDLMEHPKANAARIADLEKQMNARAHELADAKKWADREDLLGKEVAGVPLHEVPLDKDPAYTAMEDEWRDLMVEPKRNAAAIADLEKKMKARAGQLADEQKWADREELLGNTVEDMPLRSVGLDDDAAYLAMEDEQRDLKRDPERNARRLADLEKKMKARAHELAKKAKEEERAQYLPPLVDGLEHSALGLDKDPEFKDLEAQRRQLVAEDPRGNAAAVAKLEDALRARAEQLAAAKKAADRDGFLDPKPENVALKHVDLDEDPEFTALESEWRKLTQDPKANARRVAELQKKMNDRAHELADAKKWADRNAVLDPKPEGVKLAHVPLDKDGDFLAMEDEWRDLMEHPKANAARIADLEKQMNARAHELADAKKWADREDLLGKEVAGVPLHEVPLDKDPAYTAMEDEWRDLMVEPKRNAAAIADLEKKMKARAGQLADEQKWADREELLGNTVEDMPLRSVGLDDDAAYLAMEDEQRDLKRDPERNARRLADLEKKMKARAHELAKKAKEEERAQYLPPLVDGLEHSALGLDKDPEFKDLEAQRRQLVAEDPRGNAAAVAKLEDALRARAEQLAAAKKAADRDGFLDPKPENVALKHVDLDEDPEFTALESEWRKLTQDPKANARRVAELQKKMNDRAHELADAKKWADRNAVLDPKPEGVKLAHVPLDKDGDFLAMEDEWRDLMEHPKANAARIADLEKQMNARAHELADAKKWADREDLLGKEVAGVPLHEVPLDKDPAYTAMEDEWRDLMVEPKRNAAAIADLEKKMKARAGQLADEQKWADREELLGNTVEDMPLRSVGLDDDAAYLAMEDEQRDLKRDPERNARRLADLEKKMKARAHELAKKAKEEERAQYLPPLVDGLEHSALGLDKDPEFKDLEAQRRQLVAEDPRGNAAAVAKLEDALRARAEQLAAAKKAADRDGFLDPKPENVALKHVDLDEDPEFTALESEWRKLTQDPKANARRVAELQKKMNDRAHELADAKKWADRNAVLDPKPEGVKLAHVPLDKDGDFLAMEDEWRDLMEHPKANAARIADLEKQMNARAHELADAKKWADREDLLGKEVAGVPLHEVPLDKDPAYTAMEDEWRDLMVEPKRNAAAIADLEKKMKARAGQLADEQKWADREELLGNTVEDMPLRSVGLDDDAAYLAMEDEQRDLKRDPERNARRLADLEKKMKARAHELAKKAKEEERAQYLPPLVDGLEHSALGLDKDPEFKDLEAQRRQLVAEDPRGNAAAVAKLEDALRARAEQLAAAKKAADRDGFLDPKPENVALKHVDLDEDPEFTALESEWRKLTQDPKANARRVAELQKKMNDRAHELADAKKWADRNAVLDPKPEGVKLAHVPLDKDGDFLAMEDEWRDLMEHPKANAARIADLEKQMNARAHELADAKKWADREDLLGKEVAGVPLHEVPLDKDPAYTAMEDEWRDLMVEPKRNAAAIADLEKKMKARAGQLADEQKWADREELLGNTVEDMPLRSVGLDDDAAYLAMEDEQRDLKRDPERNARRLADLEKKMKARAHELAKKAKEEERAQYLPPLVDGLEHSALGLDKDPEFKDLEAQRRQLVAEDPRGNAAAVAKLEDALRARAEQLAAAKKAADRDGFLDPKPENVALKHVDLDEDPEFTALESEWRKLTQDPKANARRVAELQKKMNDRAHELADAKKWADRNAVLDPKPEGVKLAHVPLDKDGDFLAMEDEWRDLMEHPKANAARIADLEKQMNARAHELADAKKWADREDLLGKEVAGVPLHEVPLDKDPAYTAMEDEWRDLMVEPKRNAAAIADLEKKMKARAGQLADEQKWADREELLGNTVEDMPLRSVGLDDDAAYLAMEDEQRDLKRDPERNARRLADLEKKMKARAHELAKKAKEEERAQYLPPLVDGLEHSALGLDKDPEFKDLEAQRRQLVAEDPRGNAAAVAKLEDALRARAEQLAAAKKAADRDGFLDPKPENVALKHVDLDEDPEFTALESEWRKLTQDPKANARRVAELQKKMNDRAHELADAKKWADRNAVLDPKPEGVKLAHVPLDKDGDFLAMEDEWRDLMEHPKANAARIADLEKQMNARAHELADAKKWADREDLLGKEVAGVPLHEVPLDKDPAYTAMEDEWRDLMVEPKRNAAAIADLEKKMKARAGQLADEQKWADREELLGNTVEDMPLRSVGLDDDAAYLAMEDEQRDLKRDPERNARRLADLEKKMKARAHELAKKAKEEERAQYLPPLVDGLEHSALGLDKDPEFKDLEAQRRQLVAEDPRGNAAAVAKLEDALRARAEQLAAAKKAADRDGFLDPKPENVALKHVDLDEDPEFTALESEWRKLTQDPKANARRVAELQKKMNDRAHELADAKKWADRNAVLDPKPEGVKLAHVPLDKDGDFLAMEDEWRDLMEHPKANAARIADLEKQMNARAHELADAKKWADREDLLGKEVAGVPLHEVPLDKDPAYTAMEDEWRDLMVEPKRNAAAIADLEKKMKARAGQLADEQKWADREELLGNTVEDMPLRSVGLDDDAAYLAMEDEQRDLKRDPERNARRLADLEKKMKARAHELAKKAKEEERAQYLPPLVDGLEHSALGLDKDPEFKDLEAQRRQLVAEDPRGNAAAVAKLEDALRARAEQLAAAKKAADRDGFLDPKPENVALKHVDLDEDPEFTALESEWRKLTQDPKANARRVAELQKKMNDRAHELADAKKWADRNAVLDPKPEGVKLAHVPLDKDGDFLAMEDEWRDLMEHPKANAARIADLEKQMNARAHELADAKKWADREDLLGKEVAGVPLHEVPLDKDPAYTAMEDEWRDLMVEPKRNAAAIADLEKKMKARAGQLADEQKWADREELLGNTVEDMPLRSVGLDDDAAYLAMEDEQRDLKRDPERNARRLADLEKKMKARAHELAKKAKEEERAQYLPPLVDGLEHSALGLDKDPEFKDLEAQRRQLVAEDPRGNAAAVAKLEDALRARAEQLAAAKKAADRDGFLDPKPENVALKHVDLDEDPEFTALESEWRKLTQDPKANARRVAELQKKMNDRAHELADAKKWADRNAVLDPKPEGVKLAHVPLDKDGDFLAMEDEWRDLMEHPKANAARIADLEKQMNARAHELADAKKWADREDLLGKEVAGVPLHEVPLDKDPAYTAMEDEWRDLMVEPKRNAAAIADLEKKMKARAGQLADEQKWADREELLGNTVEDMPLRSVGLDDDAAYLAMEDEQRDLKRDPERNARRLADLEKKMKARAHELAKKAKEEERAQYLPPLVDGLEHSALGLDKDPEFKDLEAQRRQLVAEDPRGNAAAVAKLEDALRARAEQLAAAKKAADRDGFLDPKPENVALKHVDLDEDPEFTALESEWRKLTQDPKANARRVAELQKKMNDRAHELADAKKWADRNAVLDPKPEGVKLAHVPLDKDGDFLAMEDEWRDLMEHPKANAARIADLEKQMNARAHELADAKKWADREDLLGKEVAGVPLHEVPLDKDPAYTAMEDEWRDLMVEPKRNAAAIADLEKKMKARAGQLADEQKWADRERVLDPRPKGVALRDVGVDDDEEFLAVENEWRRLRHDPKRNDRVAAQMEKKLNDRAYQLADEKKWRDRIKVLGTHVGGHPVQEIDFDGDERFAALEENRRNLLKEPKRNKEAVGKVEDEMRQRATELVVEAYPVSVEEVLDPKPEGVELKYVPLEQDSTFKALEREWRKLMLDPKRNARRIADLEDQMNGRAHELAGEKKWADRDRILDPEPEGIALRDLDLDGDRVFTDMEEEWRHLMQDPRRNARRIADLEKKMNDRVHLLAKEAIKKAAALPFREADGVPVALLGLEEDDAFHHLATDYARSKKDPAVNAGELRELEKRMRERAEELARRRKEADRRRIVGEEMDAMRDGGAELDDDDMFLALERERYNLEAADAKGNKDRIKSLEQAMRHRARELARPPLHSEYRGIPVEKLNEFSGGELFHKTPGGNRRGRSPTGPAEPIDPELDEEARELAQQMVEQESYSFLGETVHGVPVDKIPFRQDQTFNDLADERRRAMYHPEKFPPGYKAEMEEAMRRRVEELADQYKRDHPKRRSDKEAAQPKRSGRSATKPHETSQDGSSGPRRPRDKKVVKEVEERTEERHLETVEEAAPFVDPSFHSANQQVADLWPRIADVYPAGAELPLLPDYPSTADVASPAGDLTYLAPFLAALCRQPPLLHRLFQTKTHPVRAPYSFVFFNPDSSPVTVEIDDRVPCDEQGVPRFTVSPTGAWWPLLLEKAYAKYVGGYERFDDCTSHETLRDLTGRPVTHLPLDTKLAGEVAGCNYRDVAFWRRTRSQLEMGDVFMAVSNDVVPDGIHPHCYYAVYDVVETVPGSNDPSDIVVKLHNCYHDAPEYLGPLCAGDQDWTPTLRSVCRANPEEEPEFLYLPQPIFLRNFSSMQRCHVNCGDRLTVAGEWGSECSGGSPKYTTFRQNPMYLVQNTSSRSVTVLAELRHSAPVFYDAHDVGVYHQSALALLRPDGAAQLVAPLLAHNTHRFVQKGLLTDAREVCAEMELPPNSTCYLVPYTKKKGCFGKYQLSVYPQDNPVTLTTLRPIEETHNCMAKDVVVHPGSGTSARVDITVSEPCDVHVLLHQNKVTDPASTKRGDHLAEDEIFMAAYEDNSVLVSSSGDASNAREHAIAFQAARPGRYTFLIGCPSKPVTGSAPCTLSIYTPKYCNAAFLAVHEPTRPSIPARLGAPPGAASTPTHARQLVRQPQAPPRPSSASNGASNVSRNPRNRGYSQ